jgi:hypothetical protein
VEDVTSSVSKEMGEMAMNLKEEVTMDQTHKQAGARPMEYRLSIPYLKCLGPEVFQISDSILNFGIFAYT